MAEQLTEQLDKMIQKAALEGALTQKAVDQFHSLVKQKDALETKVCDLEDQTAALEKKNKDLNERNLELGALQGAMAQRENEVSEREKEITKLEMVAEYELQRVKDHQEMFRTVFRNSVLRKEVMTPTTGHTDQYGSRQTEYPQRDTVEEEEQ